MIAGHPSVIRVLFILGIPTAFQQWKRQSEVPEVHRYRLRTMKTASRSQPGRRLTCFTYVGGLTLRSCVGFGVFLEEVERGRFFGGELGGLRNLLERNGRGHFRKQLNAAVVLQARPSGDKAAHDDVFLEPTEIVDLAGDGSFREHASRFLEARSRDERIGRERRLGDAEKEWTACCRTAPPLQHFIVFLAEAE